VLRPYEESAVPQAGKRGEMIPEVDKSVTLPDVEGGFSSRADASSGSRLLPAGQLVPFVLVLFLFFPLRIPNSLNGVPVRHTVK